MGAIPDSQKSGIRAAGAHLCDSIASPEGSGSVRFGCAGRAQAARPAAGCGLRRSAARPTGRRGLDGCYRRASMRTDIAWMLLCRIGTIRTQPKGALAAISGGIGTRPTDRATPSARAYAQDNGKRRRA
ncbi:hypothetical protein ABIE09_004166 [Lysobacter enzymogenes]|uniref:hypothetical protein n=1 Tax=Lysobacter enzymogenes TaxID=69 RepID=UPI003396B7A3